MRRIIEDLVEKRKLKQDKLKETFNSLARLFDDPFGFNFFRNKKKISAKFLELNEAIDLLMEARDKEWDAYSNNHSTMVFKSLQWKIEKLEAEYSNVKTLLGNFIALEQSLDRMIEKIDGKTGAMNMPDAVERLKTMKDHLSVYQYSDFEQRFRGDEEKVKEKLRGYLPIFAQSDSVLDIGCGRGEFMELLIAEGKTAVGIDMSQSMLLAAREKGLSCTHTDALSYLKNLDSQSMGGIFSAQVIEHLEPDYLRNMVIEACRVLKPGAPMLLETVNPLSLFALSNIYFLDVTHCKPLHPEFMRYLLESSGFDGVEVLYPEELTAELLEAVSPQSPSAREFNSNVDKLNKILYASPIYAVTGIKK